MKDTSELIHQIGDLFAASDEQRKKIAELLGGEQRFFFDQDDDCHWYLIPEDRRVEWYAWREIPLGDERGWEVPAFAERMNGGPEFYTFSSPRVNL